MLASASARMQCYMHLAKYYECLSIEVAIPN